MQYRITVRGEFGDRFDAFFEGLSIEQTGRDTTLCGPVRDQAELRGILDRLSDLGLTLISISPGADSEPPSQRAPP